MASIFIILFFVILIPVILITSIILLSTRKSTEAFENKIRTIYCYLLLLVSIIAIIISIICLINNVTEILIPNTENTNLSSYYRNLITCIGSIITFIPLGLYHSKKLKNNI